MNGVASGGSELDAGQDTVALTCGGLLELPPVLGCSSLVPAKEVVLVVDGADDLCFAAGRWLSRHDTRSWSRTRWLRHLLMTTPRGNFNPRASRCHAHVTSRYPCPTTSCLRNPRRVQPSARGTPMSTPTAANPPQRTRPSLSRQSSSQRQSAHSQSPDSASASTR